MLFHSSRKTYCIVRILYLQVIIVLLATSKAGGADMAVKICCFYMLCHVCFEILITLTEHPALLTHNLNEYDKENILSMKITLDYEIIHT